MPLLAIPKKKRSVIQEAILLYLQPTDIPLAGNAKLIEVTVG